MSSPGSDSYESHTRKRVGKACDRCRLKKSKCDGANPCSRCKADNAICVFGERRKSHDKVYPKGYVEMLEQQQSQLVAGLREMYTSLVKSGRWPGSSLKEHDGFPLTHDILERLGVLHMTGENPVGPENFEDNLEVLQARLMAENGASSARQRRSSPSTDSDPGLSHMDSPHSSPTLRHSSVSSTSSRKRASPETPPPSDSSAMVYPSKQQRYNTPAPVHQDELESQFWTQPIVINSPAEFDFSSLAASDSMYGPSITPMVHNLSTMPINLMPTSIPMGIMTYDSDWDSFLRSGVDRSFS